jgi:hypothetical protein
MMWLGSGSPVMAENGSLFLSDQVIDDYYYLFIVLRPAQEYFTYMETSPLPVKGCKI